jgi:hypothetical protein
MIFRPWCLPRYGSCLHRFRAPLSSPSIWCLLLHSRQTESSFQTPLLKSGGQINRRPLRSKHSSDWAQVIKALSRPLTSSSPLFKRDPQAIPVSNHNLLLTATSVAAIYKHRWSIELFFKWIKQNLRIKGFFGTSPNSVKTQIWISISVYVLVAIVKKRLVLEQSLSQILRIFSLTLFEKMRIFSLFEKDLTQIDFGDSRKQLSLFNI